MQARTRWLAAAVTLAGVRAAAWPRLVAIDVEGARVAESSLDQGSPSFVTVIDARTPSARMASVADLVEREAGVNLRSLGGLGAFTSISIRGSDPNEVAVYLDGVPLNRASTAAVDLSQIPVDGLERVEVYRGMPLAEFGGQAIGGAINLVSRKGARAPSWRLSLGGGSFGARSATIGYGFGGRAFHADASVAYHGATGDFIYYDNNGTLLNRADDAPGRRRNNDFNQVSADVTVGGGRRDRWQLAAHGFLKEQGVPGIGVGQEEVLGGPVGRSRTARFRYGRLLLDGEFARTGWRAPGVDLRLGAHLLLERTAFDNHNDDAAGTFGASRTDGETWAGGADVRFQAAAGGHQLLTTLFAIEVEHHRPTDLLRPDRSPSPSTRLRASFTLADDVRLLGERLTLAPALRVEGIANQLASGLAVIAFQSPGSSTSEAYLSPQLGVRLEAARGLVLKGSVGRYARVPTTLELFGDGALVLPRPSLRTEIAVGGDVGGVFDLARGPFTFSVEADLFGREVSDYIAFVPSAYGFSALNVGDERFLGAEGRARFRWGGALALTADYTFVHSVTEAGGATPGAEGHALPGIPAHKLGLRADVAAGPFGLFYELLYTGAVWLNAQNLDGNLLPARSLHALGAHAGPFPGWPLTFSVEVRNLADLRFVDRPLGGLIHRGQTTPYPLVDFADYPLPGRAVYATLSFQR